GPAPAVRGDGAGRRPGGGAAGPPPGRGAGPLRRTLRPVRARDASARQRARRGRRGKRPGGPVAGPAGRPGATVRSRAARLRGGMGPGPRHERRRPEPRGKEPGGERRPPRPRVGDPALRSVALHGSVPRDRSRLPRTVDRACPVPAQEGLRSSAGGAGREERPVRRLVPLVPAAAIVVLSPFGEGGRAPLALFILHTLSLACAGLAWTSPRPLDLRPPLFADPLRGLPVLAVGGLGFALLSALRASYPLAAALGLWDILVPFLLFAAAAHAVSDDGALEWLFRAAVASTTLQTLLALARYPGGRVAAAGSSFVNPNHLAAFLNLGLFLILVGVRRPAPPRIRATWGALGALHVVAIFLLESRGALAAF